MFTTRSTSWLKKALPGVLSVAVSFGIASCSSGGDSGAMDDFDPNTVLPDAVDATIAEQLLEDDRVFSILLERLQRADLVGDLSGDNNGNGWTLFAPEDDVFGTDPLFQDLTLTQQVATVAAHVASGTFLSSDLIIGETITMQDGSEALIELAGDGSTITVGGAPIIARDRRVNNGVIHRVGALITTQ